MRRGYQGFPSIFNFLNVLYIAVKRAPMYVPIHLIFFFFTGSPYEHLYGDKTEGLRDILNKTDGNFAMERYSLELLSRGLPFPVK